MKLSLIGYSFVMVILLLSPYVEGADKLTPDQVLNACYSKSILGHYKKNDLTTQCLQKIIDSKVAPEGLNIVIPIAESNPWKNNVENKFQHGLEFLSKFTPSQPLNTQYVAKLIESVCSQEPLDSSTLSPETLRNLCYVKGLRIVWNQYPPKTIDHKAIQVQYFGPPDEEGWITLSKNNKVEAQFPPNRHPNYPSYYPNVVQLQYYSLPEDGSKLSENNNALLLPMGLDGMGTPYRLKQALGLRTWKNLTAPQNGYAGGAEDQIKHLYQLDKLRQEDESVDAQVQQDIDMVKAQPKAAR